MIRGIKNYITAWIEYYNQRDLVTGMVNTGQGKSKLCEKEKKRLHEMRQKALTQKRIHL